MPQGARVTCAARYMRMIYWARGIMGAGMGTHARVYIDIVYILQGIKTGGQRNRCGAIIPYSRSLAVRLSYRSVFAALIELRFSRPGIGSRSGDQRPGRRLSAAIPQA